MNRIIIFFILSYFSANLCAQTIKLKGRVIDTDSFPIPNVHVYIPDVLVGTITNTKGEFLLNVNKDLLDSTLVFSSVGYNSQIKQLRDIKTKNLTIFLSESIQLLNQVVIKPDYSDSARAILFKAVSNLKNNYSSKLYYLDGFFREVSYKDSLVTRLIEAAIRINSKSYKFNPNNLAPDKLKIDVVQIRKSDDNRTYTNWDRTFKFMFGVENNIYKVFREDYIRYLNQKTYHFLSTKAINNFYTYKIDNIMVDKTDTVYVISTEDKGKIQTRSIKFYINKTDWAIIKFKQELRYNDIKSFSGGERKNPNILSSTVLYQKYRGKYYINFLDVKRYGGAMPILDNGELQTVHLQFMLNNIFIKGDIGYERIKRKEAVHHDEDLYTISQEYNPDFWKNYNMILYDPLKSKIISDLEKERPLETQFEKNN